MISLSADTRSDELACPLKQRHSLFITPRPRSRIPFAQPKVRQSGQCLLAPAHQPRHRAVEHTGPGSHSAAVPHGLATLPYAARAQGFGSSALLCGSGDCAVWQHSLAHGTRPHISLPSVPLHLDGPRPHARLSFSLRWLPVFPLDLLRPFGLLAPILRADAGYPQHPPEAALSWRPQMVSALNRTWLRKQQQA